MQYFGSGIGHTTIAIQSTREDVAMDIDEDGKSDDEVMGTAQVSESADHRFLEELQKMVSAMAEGGTASDREDVEQTLDSDDDEHDSDEDMDDMSMDNDDDLGPEDGEDEGYVDTGYGGL
jgi:hypothetical protein